MFAVELEHISKTFPGGVQANKDITLRIEKGEVHGLLGENGAGKSTLMNILYGLLSYDEGRIVVNGEEVAPKSPEHMIERGVGMVHQHFKLIPPLTVTENIMMGSEPREHERNTSARLVVGILALFSIILFYHNLGIVGGTVATIALTLLIMLAFHAYDLLTKLCTRLWEMSEQRTGLSSSIIGALASMVGAMRYAVINLQPMSFSQAEAKIRRIAEENGLNINPRAKVADISVGLQQRVEIIKALYREAEILILDEPTSVLTPQEVDELFVTLDRFKETGKTIILITHKLREPMALCNRISVLRDGVLVGTVNRDETSAEDLAQMMVGRPVVFEVEKGPPSMGDVMLKVEDLYVDDVRGLPAIKGVSLEVRAGEIYGIAGVEGNGQTELVEAITGLTRPQSGTIIVNGEDITREGPRKVKEAGVAHIPEDRHKRGLILPFTIEENLVLGAHYRAPFAKGILLNLNVIKSHAQKLVSEFSIKVPRVDVPASNLSGGNQQKVVVARELSTKPRVVVAAQPTRGLDVGATEYIHNVLVRMRDRGVAVLLVSAELDEIRSLSDRIGIIFNGQIVAERDPEVATPQELGLLMAGHFGNQTQEADIA